MNRASCITRPLERKSVGADRESKHDGVHLMADSVSVLPLAGELCQIARAATAIGDCPTGWDRAETGPAGAAAGAQSWTGLARITRRIIANDLEQSGTGSLRAGRRNGQPLTGRKDGST